MDLICHCIFFTWDIPPEHYHIWINLKKLHVKIRKNRYRYLNYIRPSGLKKLSPLIESASQGEYIFDDEITRRAPRLHDRAKDISTLRVIG